LGEKHDVRTSGGGLCDEPLGPLEVRRLVVTARQLDAGGANSSRHAHRIRTPSRQALTCWALGVWRSLVARSVRVGEVPSSNLGTPIDAGETMFPPRAPFFRRSQGRARCWPPAGTSPAPAAAGCAGSNARRSAGGAETSPFLDALVTRWPVRAGTL